MHWSLIHDMTFALDYGMLHYVSFLQQKYKRVNFDKLSSLTLKSAIRGYWVK